MLCKRAPDIRASEITDESLYVSRRDFLKSASSAALGAVMSPLGATAVAAGPAAIQESLSAVKSTFSTNEEWNTLDDITHYNNFYEFGFDKEDPAEFASRMKTKPWTIKVEGQMNAPAAEYHLDDILRPHALEERVYRLRCVEGWSVVVPWIGFSLADLIKRFDPTSSARFLEFQTLYRPGEMRGQRNPVPVLPAAALRNPSRAAETQGVLEWPYIEGLRLDEAMNPLTILAVGLYGKILPNQNGAPIRLVVPWKYGFKSIKSIVKIRFVKSQPTTTWNLASPREFGFYANVNPDVSRPDSQKTERRLGKFFRQPTLLFNGYADLVGHMYEKMDLKKDF